MEAVWVKVEFRGQYWHMRPLTISGTELTMQVRDRGINMPSSCLEFSLWDGRCKQIPDLVMSSETVEALRPWVEASGQRWRIGWKRKGKAAKKPKPEDPRQGKLF